MLFFRCEESEAKTTMDVKKKEMDLLSNTIAAYAHIKGTYAPLCYYTLTKKIKKKTSC